MTLPSGIKDFHEMEHEVCCRRISYGDANGERTSAAAAREKLPFFFLSLLPLHGASPSDLAQYYSILAEPIASLQKLSSSHAENVSLASSVITPVRVECLRVISLESLDLHVLTNPFVCSTDQLPFTFFFASRTISFAVRATVFDYFAPSERQLQLHAKNRFLKPENCSAVDGHIDLQLPQKSLSEASCKRPCPGT